MNFELTKMKKIFIVGLVVVGFYFLFAGAGGGVSSRAVIIDNSYGYPIAFHIPDQGLVSHTDPRFEEIAKHWNHNAGEYNSAIIESGFGLEEMQQIEKHFIKQ